MGRLTTVSGRTRTGGLSPATSTKTANYTVTTNDFALAGNATAGAITFTLGANLSSWYRFKKTDFSTNAVIITTSNSKTIEGAASLTIANQGNSVDLMSDENGNWWIF